MRSEASATLATTVAVLMAGVVPASAATAASDAEALRERATAYWEAKAARSDAVFDFYAPVEEGGPPRDQIYEGKQARYASAVVEKVEVNDATGVVHVKIEIASFDFASPAIATALEQHPEEMRRTVRDAWVQVGGTWYRKPRVPFGGRFVHKKKIAPTDGAREESSGEGGK